MSKPGMSLLLVLVCCSVLLASGPVQAQPGPAAYHLTWTVVGGGGAIGMQSGDYTLGATIGQTAIGWSENGEGLGSGFWYGVGPALSTVYLPLVLK